MCSGRDIRPRHTTEQERETQPQITRWGGFWGTRPHHEERVVDPVETKGWEGLWLCDTRQGASGYAIPDKGQSTPHREGERGGGSGLAIPDRGQSPGPEGDKRGTHQGGVAGDHEVDP